MGLECLAVQHDCNVEVSVVIRECEPSVKAAGKVTERTRVFWLVTCVQIVNASRSSATAMLRSEG